MCLVSSLLALGVAGDAAADRWDWPLAFNPKTDGKLRTLHETLALLALIVAPAFAQPGPPPPGPPDGPGPGHLGFVLRALELTEEQQTEVDSLLAARRQLDEADRPAVEAAHRALGEQVRAATFDESAIRARAAAVAVHDAERLVADAALLRDVRALLTDAQRETLERLLTPPEPPPGGPGPLDRRGPRGR